MTAAPLFACLAVPYGQRQNKQAIYGKAGDDLADFNTYTEWQSVHEQGLTALVNEVPAAETAADPQFTIPLKLLSKWHAMPGDIPHYSNIDPTKFDPKILPSLFILDAVFKDGEDTDFRWRLFGTANRQRYGIEATGYRLSKAMHLDASIAESLRLARLVQQFHTPRFMKTRFVKNEKLYHEARTVILPLSDDNGVVARLFGCTTWAP